VNARDIQVQHLLCQRWLHLTAQIQELALLIFGQTLSELPRIPVEQAGQLSKLRMPGRQRGWVGPERFNRRAYCKRFAIAITDNTPIGINGFGTKRSLLALAAQKLLIQHMQFNQPRADQARHQENNPSNGQVPPCLLQ